MPSKPPRRKKPKLSDLERHKRFVETAKKLGADKDEKALDRALNKIKKSS